MRFILVAALALSALLLPVAPADARSRSEQAQSRPAATQASRAATARRAEVPQRQARAARTSTRQARATQASTRQARAARPTSRQAARATRARGSRQVAARTSGGQRQAAANCTRGSRCTPRTVAWQSGLAPATNMQAQSCPTGTLATLARGHSDVVRCVPL